MTRAQVDFYNDKYITKAYESGSISIACANKVSKLLNVSVDEILDLPQGSLFECWANELFEEEEEKEGYKKKTQFTDELYGLIERHALENSLSYNEIIGSLFAAALDQWSESRMSYYEEEE